MVKIKNNPSNKDAQVPLKVQNQKFKEMGSLIENLRHRVHLLDLKAAVLGGAYVNLILLALVYGLLIFPSSARRSLYLLLLCLSLSVSVAFWPAFVATVNDCMRTRFQQESCFLEQDKMYRKICSVRRNDGGGGGGGGGGCLDFASERRRRHAYVRVLYAAMLLWTISVPCLLLSAPAHHSIYSGSLSI